MFQNVRKGWGLEVDRNHHPNLGVEEMESWWDHPPAIEGQAGAYPAIDPIAKLVASRSLRTAR